VNQIYYQCGELDIFFFSNYSLTRPFSSDAEFEANGKSAWLWNAETGERFLYPTDESGNGFLVNLDPAESKVFVFSNNPDGNLLIEIAPVYENALEITSPWTVKLEHIDGTAKTIWLDSLVDFKDSEELNDFAGAAWYENTVSINNPSEHQSIDLGKVSGISELMVNGAKVGVKWHGKHIYEVSKFLQKGENNLKIKVTTTLGNYVKSLKENKDSQKWMKNQPLHSNGLIGPVKIISLIEQS
jgi:hypothetical protein